MNFFFLIITIGVFLKKRKAIHNKKINICIFKINVLHFYLPIDVIRIWQRQFNCYLQKIREITYEAFRFGLVIFKYLLNGYMNLKFIFENMFAIQLSFKFEISLFCNRKNAFQFYREKQIFHCVIVINVIQN